MRMQFKLEETPISIFLFGMGQNIYNRSERLSRGLWLPVRPYTLRYLGKQQLGLLHTRKLNKTSDHVTRDKLRCEFGYCNELLLTSWS